MKKKNIAILGSTGSIGKTTLNIIKKNKKEFNIFFLSTNKNINTIYKQAIENDVKNKVNHKKLQKLFIKELNFYFSDFDIFLRDCDLNNHVWPTVTDRDDVPNGHSQFQFFVDYKGIKNRRKF